MKTEQDKSYIAARIKAEREKKHWSISELARELQLSRSTVSQWEKGKYYPRPESIRQMCQLFGVDYDSMTLHQSATDARPIQGKAIGDIRISDLPKEDILCGEAFVEKLLKSPLK